MHNLPDLCFLPVDRLLIHERHDEQRCQPLILRIRASGVFRNPPVVSPLLDGTDRFMVLDGANRITALRMMGFPHALVQIVQPDDPGLTLQTWNHIVWEHHAARFIQNIRSIPGVRLHRVDPERVEPGLEAECGLALVMSCRGRAYSVCTEVMRLEHRVDVLNALVDSYKESARLDRTTARDVSAMQDVFPGLCGLVIFPAFDIRDLLRLAGRRYLLPAGVTRFMISPRALHVNYPLDELAADKPLEAKNQALSRWIQERLARKGVRYYAEPTYLFDE
jgi:hypothetical protein